MDAGNSADPICGHIEMRRHISGRLLALHTQHRGYELKAVCDAMLDFARHQVCLFGRPICPGKLIAGGKAKLHLVDDQTC